MKRRGLGKGLEALLGDSVNLKQDTKSTTENSIKVKYIKRNPYQPRKTFDEDALNELAKSIKQYGIIQPIAVRNVGKNNYEIIAGERRFLAAQKVGLKEVPIVIHNIDDKESATFALIENLQREDLNSIEKAIGIKKLISEFNLTHIECAKVLSQSRSSISNTLRLLDLSDAVQDALVQKHIDMGHARALLGLDEATQFEILQQIKIQGLSVRETEELARDEKDELISEVKIERAKKTKWTKEIEKSLNDTFNNKVDIRARKNGSGKITISFDNEDDIKEIIEKFNL